MREDFYSKVKYHIVQVLLVILLFLEAGYVVYLVLKNMGIL